MIKEQRAKLSKTKYLELNNRNNSNSFSCNNCSSINISRNNDKFSI